MGAGCPSQTAGGAPQGRGRRTWFSEALGARPSRAPGGPRAATAPPPRYSCGLEGGEGRTGGPCDHLQAPRSHPSRRLCLKSSNMEALEGPLSRAPGGPEEGTQAALQTKGVELGGPGGAGGPWGGEDGKGCWVTEGGTHGRTRRAPCGRAGGGERLAATATSHQALSYVP